MSNGVQMPATGLVGYLDGLVESLRVLLPLAAQADQVEAVHDARVTTRRLGAALRLFEPVISKKSGKRAGRLLRSLRRRFGDLRDADVMLEHLAELGRLRGLARAARWAAGQLRERRAKDLARLAGGERVERTAGRLAAWQPLRWEIREAQSAIPELLSGSLHEQLLAFASAADALCKKGRRRPTGQAADPHAVRIAGKALRYTLEMAREADHPLPREILKTFKNMQDALGLWHDYAVLTDHLLRQSRKAGLAFHDARLLRAVLRLVAETTRRAERHLDEFRQLWSQSGMDIARTIGDLFPPIARPVKAPVSAGAVTAPGTGPDPAG